ncbi:hypothetical protein ACDQ55_18545 [Chitinophaga sp. 30R24]|uniref:hypothetical protein n=1 Tax=Chitinophaga sp. 30R24 TaxID=3248838 RepID=UPI003B907E13
MSDQMSLAGYASNDQGYLYPTTEQLDYRMPFTGDVKTYGMPVTSAAFLGMLNNFYKFLLANPEVQQAFQGVLSIDFSKASLLRILSQEGCEYIRFHFAIPEENQQFSLVAEGITGDQSQVGYEQLLKRVTENTITEHNSFDPKFEERGNGKDGDGKFAPYKQLFDILKKNNSPLATADLEKLF